MATKSPSTDSSQDVPIFLRKTYHMIDTCNPEVACWSDDGETFVVKDPNKFERTIIPQFFKHSKFSSFVRQLNFYSFRKIRYSDTIRIDPKLEEETKNYWRFKHESFRRGRPELLSEIKRMNGQKQTGVAGAKPEKPEEGAKSEVHALKKRIEEMSKNIDNLTELVQKVNLKQEQEEQFGDASVGAKRKKMEADDIPRPDEMLSSMDIEEMVAIPALSMPSMPTPSPSVRATSEASSAPTDNEFVDQLFTAFNEDDDVPLFDEGALLSPEALEAEVDPNQPDPEMMKRLSDALMLLPKDIQAMIVDRLIKAITSGDIPKTLPVVAAEKKAPEVSPVHVQTPSQTPSETPEVPPEMPMSLITSTLAVLLQMSYPSHMEGKSPSKALQKAIPVIPVHA